MSRTWFNHNSADKITRFNSYNTGRIGFGTGDAKIPNVSFIDISVMSDVIEICGVKIAIGSELIDVKGIYHPPNKSISPQFFANISYVLFRFSVNNCVLLAGDLN